MTTNKLLATSLVALSLSACSNDSTHAPPAAPPAPAKLDTASAVRVHGDLVPTKLVSLAIPAPTERDLIVGSDPAAKKKPFAIEMSPEPSIRREFMRLMTAQDPGSFTFPVDAPDGARVIVRAVDRTASLTTVHMHEVASGKRLDMARDAQTSSLTGRRVDQAAGGGGLTSAAGMVGKRGATMNAPADAPPAGAPAGTLPREPGFEPLLMAHRLLSFDVPARAGRVMLDVPADIARTGVLVEVQQPNSHITLAGAARELAYGYGDTAEIALTLANDGSPIDGATFTASLEAPNGSLTPGVTFTSAGNGQYVARLPMSGAELAAIGVYHVRAKATGLWNGVAFERDIEAAFGYYPAHAHMTQVTAPQVIKGSDGLIDAVQVDVDVESLVDDRFGLRGTLVYTASDGSEHAIAVAQTGQTMGAGRATISLRFDAKDFALAKVDGPFHVRDLALVSHAFSITQHRLGRGLDLVTPAMFAREMRYPKVLSLAAQDLLENGDL